MSRTPTLVLDALAEPTGPGEPTHAEIRDSLGSYHSYAEDAADRDSPPLSRFEMLALAALPVALVALLISVFS